MLAESTNQRREALHAHALVAAVQTLPVIGPLFSGTIGVAEAADSNASTAQRARGVGNVVLSVVPFLGRLRGLRPRRQVLGLRLMPHSRRDGSNRVR